MLRGGSGEAVQLVFHGPGFVVVQSYEWSNPRSDSQGGGLIGQRGRPVQLTGLDGRPRGAASSRASGRKASGRPSLGVRGEGETR